MLEKFIKDLGLEHYIDNQEEINVTDDLEEVNPQELENDFEKLELNNNQIQTTVSSLESTRSFLQKSIESSNYSEEIFSYIHKQSLNAVNWMHPDIKLPKVSVEANATETGLENNYKYAYESVTDLLKITGKLLVDIIDSLKKTAISFFKFLFSTLASRNREILNYIRDLENSPEKDTVVVLDKRLSKALKIAGSSDYQLVDISANLKTILHKLTDDTLNKNSKILSDISFLIKEYNKAFEIFINAVNESIDEQGRFDSRQLTGFKTLLNPYFKSIREVFDNNLVPSTEKNDYLGNNRLIKTISPNGANLETIQPSTPYGGEIRITTKDFIVYLKSIYAEITSFLELRNTWEIQVKHINRIQSDIQSSTSIGQKQLGYFEELISKELGFYSLESMVAKQNSIYRVHLSEGYVLFNAFKEVLETTGSLVKYFKQTDVSNESSKLPKLISLEELKQAEKELGLTFAKDFVEHLTTNGANLESGELMHPSNGHLNIVKNTQEEWKLNSKISNKLYLILNEGIDGILYWQDSQGKVYMSRPRLEATVVNKNLEDFLNSRK